MDSILMFAKIPIHVLQAVYYVVMFDHVEHT